MMSVRHNLQVQDVFISTEHFISPQFAKLARDMKVPGGIVRSKSPEGGTSGSLGTADEEEKYPGGLC